MPPGEAKSAAIPRFDMPLDEAMQTQRAIRRIKSDPVDDALVLRMLELALKAPSGGDRQNVELVVVRDPAVKAQLARLNRVAWRLYGSVWRFFARNDPKTLRAMKAVDWEADHYVVRLDRPLGEAPVARQPLHDSPPSTGRTTPVMYFASSEARNSAA